VTAFDHDPLAAEVGAVLAGEVAALRFLDLDNLGAQTRKEQGAIGPGERAGEVEHGEAFERPGHGMFPDFDGAHRAPEAMRRWASVSTGTPSSPKAERALAWRSANRL
jgi:hypothetical protein